MRTIVDDPEFRPEQNPILDAYGLVVSRFFNPQATDQQLLPALMASLGFDLWRLQSDVVRVQRITSCTQKIADKENAEAAKKTIAGIAKNCPYLFEGPRNSEGSQI